MITLTAEQAQQIEEVLSGMLHGTDWNNGTHAKIYRPKFPEALATIRAARAQGQAEQGPVHEALQIASVALQDISCSSQTENLYWWQLRARKAQKQIAECLTNAAPIKPVKQEHSGEATDMVQDHFAGVGKPIAEQERVSIPLENSQEAAEAIEKIMAEYGYPSNAYNAARAGWRAARLFAPVEPVKQEPVAFEDALEAAYWNFDARVKGYGKWKLNRQSERDAFKHSVRGIYAAPVRTKDLTDDEIDQVRDKTWCFSNSLREFARAVIAADREKNRG